MNPESTVILHPQREKLPLNRHPWIFSGAVKAISEEVQPGDWVRVKTSQGRFIAWGQMGSPTASIWVRLFSWSEECPDEAWLKARLLDAVTLRQPILRAGETDCCRLVFSESDFLPGLIVDRFGETLILQSSAPGIDRLKHLVARLLLELIPDCVRVWEKSDSDGRRLEKMEPVCGLLAGTPMPESLTIRENGFTFSVSPSSQKTGFYTDQRENRAAVIPWVTSGAKILDVCSFTGAFSVAALSAGAEHATLIDTSEEALRHAAVNLELNGFSESVYTLHRDSAFDALRNLKRAGSLFDMIILDPPKLIRSSKQSNAAVAGYKDLNLQAIQLLRRGGILVTFSCSGNLSADDLRLMLAYAAKDANRTVQIVRTLTQASDHPVLTSVTETAYLKGYIARVL